MKKTIKLFHLEGPRVLFLLFLMLWNVSCSDFLVEDPKGQLAKETFFSDKNDLQMAVTAVYAKVRTYMWSNDHHLNMWAGDDISTHPASNKQYFREFDQYTVSENNAWMEVKWTDLWVIVKAANFVINNAAKTPVSADEIKYAIAQAAYWRAFAYFHLVQCWGPLPIMLKEEVNYDAQLSPVDSVYQQIVSDLKLAEEAPVLWTTEPQEMNGYNIAVSQGAAKATLSYVYLSMAGWPLNKGTEYYELAAAKAKEVIDGAENGIYYYRLLDEYKKVYSMEYNNKNPEVIMSFAFDFASGYYGNSNLSPYCDIPQDCNGWGDSYAEINFWKQFPDGPRKEATYAPKTLINKSLVNWWDDAREIKQPWFIKACEGDNQTEWDYTKGGYQGTYLGGKSYQIVRLAEVYCWYAEAIGRSGQTNTLAIDLLNRVRNRADGKQSNIYPANMTADQLAEAAYNEHGWEIAGYYWGNIAPRYYDMFRMNRVKDHFAFRSTNSPITVASGVTLQETVPVTGTWNDSKMYAPYPYNDRLMNPNLKR